MEKIENKEIIQNEEKNQILEKKLENEKEKEISKANNELKKELPENIIKEELKENQEEKMNNENDNIEEEYNFYNSKSLKIKIFLKKDKIILIKKKTKNILFEDFIGCRLYKSENILKKPKLELIFTSINEKKYKKFGIEKLKEREFIFTELYHDSLEKLKLFKKKIMKTFYSQEKNNFKLKHNKEFNIDYYKKVLIFVNPNSGKGQAIKLFEKSKKILKANGILFEMILTQKDSFVEEYIFNLSKQTLKSYDIIASISGDGTPHQIINGFFKRKDIDFKNQKLTLCSIPAGSGCALFEYCMKSNLNNSTFLNSLFALCQINKRELPVHFNSLIDCEGEVRNVFSFLSLNYGFFGDVDVESEFLRFMGDKRFDFYGFIRFMNLRRYKTKVFLPKNGEVLPGVNEVIEESEDIEKFDCELFSFFVCGLPYLSKNYLSCPLLKNNLGNFNLQFFEAKKGKMAFFKYATNHEKHNPEKGHGVIEKLVKSFRIEIDEDKKKKTIVFDGENYKDYNIKTIQSEISNYTFNVLV